LNKKEEAEDETTFKTKLSPQKTGSPRSMTKPTWYGSRCGLQKIFNHSIAHLTPLIKQLSHF
jgi:hypothetical protein